MVLKTSALDHLEELIGRHPHLEDMRKPLLHSAEPVSYTHLVYLMYTYRHEGRVYNRVSRFRDTGSGLTDERPMVTRIPGALYHNGGIIRFGPDGMLYIGTGDGGEPERAQDRSCLLYTSRCV